MFPVLFLLPLLLSIPVLSASFEVLEFFVLSSISFLLLCIHVIIDGSELAITSDFSLSLALLRVGNVMLLVGFVLFS